ncbi:hypothetical protein [Cerasibacillus terrae]|uniref:hypothetical protein n=1 Tax=Cerasibacillus terrae TaxID=2498845 RepID=UPI001747AE9D|nr:hypothetical protein [Cerasibacillus terrae]
MKIIMAINKYKNPWGSGGNSLCGMPASFLSSWQYGMEIIPAEAQGQVIKNTHYFPKFIPYKNCLV